MLMKNEAIIASCIIFWFVFDAKHRPMNLESAVLTTYTLA